MYALSLASICWGFKDPLAFPALQHVSPFGLGIAFILLRRFADAWTTNAAATTTTTTTIIIIVKF